MLTILTTYPEVLIDGFLNTLFSSIIALFFSLIIGTLMAILQLSKNKWVSGLANAYVEFFKKYSAFNHCDVLLRSRSFILVLY